jgi:hypothetical protein
MWVRSNGAPRIVADHGQPLLYIIAMAAATPIAPLYSHQLYPVRRSSRLQINEWLRVRVGSPAGQGVFRAALLHVHDPW